MLVNGNSPFVSAEIASSLIDEDANQVLATVRLVYCFSDHDILINGQIFKRIAITPDENEQWQPTKQKILRKAQRWFEAYFDGDTQEGDQPNIFAGDFNRRGRNCSGLTFEQEQNLQQELRLIELGC